MDLCRCGGLTRGRGAPSLGFEGENMDTGVILCYDYDYRGPGL